VRPVPIAYTRIAGSVTPRATSAAAVVERTATARPSAALWIPPLQRLRRSERSHTISRPKLGQNHDVHMTRAARPKLPHLRFRRSAACFKRRPRMSETRSLPYP
jgi:hypothetical protein